MRNKKWNDVANFSLGVLFIFMGVSVLITGEIKGMTLGDERIIPATAALTAGLWISIFYALKAIKKLKKKN